MWVTSLLATELPPCKAMLSRRSRYSEQPPSVANSTASASVPASLLNGCIGDSPWHIEHVSGERLLAGGGDAGHQGREGAGLRLRHFHLAHQEEVGVVGRQRVV